VVLTSQAVRHFLFLLINSLPTITRVVRPTRANSRKVLEPSVESWTRELRRKSRSPLFRTTGETVEREAIIAACKNLIILF